MPRLAMSRAGQMGQYLRTNVGREYKFGVCVAEPCVRRSRCPPADNGRIRRELGLEFM
jgi:hypothetical protein